MSWNPSQGGVELHAWYRAEDQSGATWPDHSGHGRNLTCTNLTAGETVGGLPSVRFDGSGTAVEAAASAVAAGPLSAVGVYCLHDPPAPYNGLYQIAPTTTPVHPPIAGLHLATDGRPYVNQSGDAGHRYLVWSELPGAVARIWDLVSHSITALPHCRSAGHTPTPRTIHSAGLTDIGGIADAHVILAHMGLAAARIDIAELILLRGAPEHSWWCEGYLAHRYGLSLPMAHPFRDAPPAAGPPTLNSGGSGSGSTNPFASASVFGGC